MVDSMFGGDHPYLMSQVQEIENMRRLSRPRSALGRGGVLIDNF